MTQQLRIQRSSTTLAAAARRRAAASYAAEHRAPFGASPLLSDDDADALLARAYRLRRKKSARRVSAARTAALLR